MALYQCKACGAPLEVRDGTEVAFCPYCGMKQTLPKDPVQVMSDGTSVDSLLKRAFMFLEDGNWAKANEYCDRGLDVEPENARAYLGKLMADVKVMKREGLANMPKIIYNNSNCKKALRFGDEGLISELKGYMSMVLLKEAINKNDIATVNDLIKAGADINAKSKGGDTALIWAASRGRTEIVNTLIEVGADINAKDNNGWTALMSAARDGNTETVKALKRASSTQASGCMTLILQALTATIIIAILAAYL